MAHSLTLLSISPPTKLEAVGPPEDEKSRYLGTVQILGIPHHFELHAVSIDDDDQQQFDADKFTSYTVRDDVLNLTGYDGPLATLTINGREYVAIITPYSVRITNAESVEVEL